MFCKKCGHDFEEEEFGTQRYCKQCWQAYKRSRGEARRVERIYQVHPKLRPPPQVPHADV
jgi:NADH pyrophosphatase NudC (nudix superfamily)